MRLWVGLAFQENVNSLLPVFEEFLKNAPNDASYDAVRQSVVVLMGSLAKHLDKSDPKVKPIVAKLIAALSTPSQQVPASWPGAHKPVGELGPTEVCSRVLGPSWGSGPRMPSSQQGVILSWGSLVYSKKHPERELFCSNRLLEIFIFSTHLLNTFFSPT